MTSIAQYWPALLAVGLVVLLIYIMIRHGRVIERTNYLKEEVKAQAKAAKTKEATDETIHKLPDSDLDNLI